MQWNLSIGVIVKSISLWPLVLVPVVLTSTSYIQNDLDKAAIPLYKITASLVASRGLGTRRIP